MIKRLLEKSNFWKFIVFCFVGGTSALIHFLVFSLFESFNAYADKFNMRLGNLKLIRNFIRHMAVVLAANPKSDVSTFIAIPYNPYEPEPYSRWTMRGMLDLDNELKVGDEFWDFLGGKGTYQDLLDCFEQVGIELRDEIDEYFARFNK
jgi:hypothetical protein